MIPLFGLAYSVQWKGREALFVKRETYCASRDTLHEMHCTLNTERSHGGAG